MRNIIAFYLALGALSAFLSTGCAAKPDFDGDAAVAEIAALVSAPLPQTAEITEFFERAERFLNSNENDSSFRAIRENCLLLLAQTKAKYGDTKSYADMFKQRLKEIDTGKLPPELRNDPNAAEFVNQMKESALVMNLLEMSRTGLAPEAIQRAASDSSPSVRAWVPYIRGELQFWAGQYEDASKSFKQAITEATTVPTDGRDNTIISEIMHLVAGHGAMLDVVLFVEECLPQNPYSFVIAKTWCKVHNDDLVAGNFEPFLKRAEAAPSGAAKSVYVRAVIKEQMKQGNFADVPKTIDRFFPQGHECNLCLSAWVFGCIQHGRLAEAQIVADSTEGFRHDIAHQMIVLLFGRDTAQDVLGKAKWMPIGINISDNAIDRDIPVPKYSDAELLEFCRWYAAKADKQTTPISSMYWTVSAANLMFELGFKKEADELFDIALAKLLATNSSAWHNISSPVIAYQIRKGDFDDVLALHEKLVQNGMRVSSLNPVASRKIGWLCEMGKFDYAIALAEETEGLTGALLATLVESLLAANRKEEAMKILEKLFTSDTDSYNRIQRMYQLLQAGMIEEFSHYIERFPDAGDKAHLQLILSSHLRADGNYADADRILLEAFKQVEKMDVDSRGGRHLKLESILRSLTFKPKGIKQSLWNFD